jgi:AcrR family transcriptional regulator
MQEIADKAGINKSLLHYYYRSKDRLFADVFAYAAKNFIPDLTMILKQEKPLSERLKEFISAYIDFISKNPFIPLFILSEINKNPNGLAKVFSNSGIDVKSIEIEIEREISAGRISPINPKHLFVNIISLCIFPIIAKNLISPIILNNDKNTVNQFYNERKKVIFDFVINAIGTEKVPF